VDWQAWCARSLADEDIVRLILDGTVIKTRVDRKAANISPHMVWRSKPLPGKGWRLKCKAVVDNLPISGVVLLPGWGMRCG